MQGKSGLVAGDNAGKWARCMMSGDGVGGGKESLNACWCLLSLTNVIYTREIHASLLWPICFCCFIKLFVIILGGNLQKKSI